MSGYPPPTFTEWIDGKEQGRAQRCVETATTRNALASDALADGTTSVRLTIKTIKIGVQIEELLVIHSQSDETFRLPHLIRFRRCHKWIIRNTRLFQNGFIIAKTSYFRDENAPHRPLSPVWPSFERVTRLSLAFHLLSSYSSLVSGQRLFHKVLSNNITSLVIMAGER